MVPIGTATLTTGGAGSVTSVLYALLCKQHLAYALVRNQQTLEWLRPLSVSRGMGKLCVPSSIVGVLYTCGSKG